MHALARGDSWPGRGGSCGAAAGERSEPRTRGAWPGGSSGWGRSERCSACDAVERNQANLLAIGFCLMVSVFGQKGLFFQTVTAGCSRTKGVESQTEVLVPGTQSVCTLFQEQKVNPRPLRPRRAFLFNFETCLPSERRCRWGDNKPSQTGRTDRLWVRGFQIRGPTWPYFTSAGSLIISPKRVSFGGGLKKKKRKKRLSSTPQTKPKGSCLASGSFHAR